MSFIKFFLALCMFFNASPGRLADLTDSLEPRSVTLSVVGDCTISTNLGAAGPGSFNWYAKNYDPAYFLEKVAPVFENDDFTVVNCETVLSDRTLTPRDKGEGTAYWFVGPSANANIFTSSGVEIACLANNHTDDFGAAGYADTVAALEAANLVVAEDRSPVYVTKDGITISILACGLWYGGAERELYKTLETMCLNSDFQIIYPHGGAEGTHQVDEWRRTAFRNLIDHGADLIVATHPHWLQPVEEYHGGTIVYSLGNFCFGGNNYPQNRTAIYQCTITKTPLGLLFSDEIIPCYVYTGDHNNWQPAPIAEDDPNYRKILDFMAGLISSPV